ncbi:MAG: MATE family efflux transporter [Rhodospirillaceae bacterium]|nr:MATE family efflux transporter [Rhodospirillaceae bacterium]MBL6929935.1 MATE family efflux transporter [Rhodospirillales bacterium]MBL6942507.1 MATE family efflux transporter [Rhodospirillales bacterium]
MESIRENWLKERLVRHVSEVLRLSWPVIVARSGVMTMALVDTIMVGRFSTAELGYLSIGLMPFMPVFLILLGMVMGTVVMTSTAFGMEKFTECGAVWRRSMPYAFGMGFAGCVVALFGQQLLLAGGQTSDLAEGGGQIMFILGLSLPAYLVTITSSLFLEGIKRPKPAMLAMIVANVVNVGMNWVFIYGHMGFPAMGAEGSAITTAVVRWLLAFAIVAYIWTMHDHHTFGVRLAPSGGWRAWAEQRRIGYSSAASIGGESMAFACIGLFAGWLGAVPLAAYSIAHNLISMAFMVSLGVASATVVRVGIARGRDDRADLQLAGWTGLAVNVVFMGLIGLMFGLFSDLLASAYSNDPAVITAAAPLVAFCGIIIIADGGQAVMVNALRGAGGIWAPALIQNFAFMIVLAPLGWWLGIANEGGAIGLYEAIFTATILSLFLLSVRFLKVSRRAANQPG